METELLQQIFDKLTSMEHEMKEMRAELAEQRSELAEQRSEISEIKTELVGIRNRLTVLEEESHRQYLILHDGYKLVYEKTVDIFLAVRENERKSEKHDLRILNLESILLKKSV